MALKKQERQAKVLEIITTQHVDSQEELMKFLQDEGIDVTQATISRDIKELRIVRRTDGLGQTRYQVLNETPAVDEITVAAGFAQLANMTTQVEFMVIVKTTAGNGNRLAALIDAADMGEVVGTLAGHDTIFVITPGAVVAEDLAAKFDEWIKAS